MMIIINRNEHVISGSVNGEQFGVSFDETKYQAMLDLQAKADTVSTVEELQTVIDEFLPLTKESYKETVETASPYIHVNKHTNKFYLKFNDKLSSQPLPQVFVDKILKSVEKNIDVTPLIKCWARFMRPVPGRPAYSIQRAANFAKYIDADYVNNAKLSELMAKEGLSDKVATQKATTKQVAITKEGLLVCYKVSEEITEKFVLDAETEEVKTKSRYTKSVDPDTGLVTYDSPKFVEERLFQPVVMKKGGDAFFCGEKEGHFIRVGQVHYLDNWDKVSDPGCKGLHCGGLTYIQCYQKEGTVTHNIFVDPMDIYGFNTSGDCALTTKRYFVYSSFGGVNKSIYHSSQYAALTDAEYAKIVEEAVKATEAKKEELAGILGEADALKNVNSATPGQAPTDTAKVFVN